MKEFISKDFLINEYTNNLKSIKDISEEFNLSKKSISKHLKLYDIKILTKYDRVVIKYKFKILEDYMNHESLTEISKKYQIAPKTIKNILAEEGVNILDFKQMSSIKNYERRKENRMYQLDYDYFKKWSNDMAYILGLIYADGNVYKNRLKIELKIDDIEILNDIKDKLKYEGEVLIAKTTCNDKIFKTARLSISSKDLCEDLVKLGVFENKSLEISFPDIPNEFLMDFIRGYFDGDGSVGIRKDGDSHQMRVRFCSGSLEFLETLKHKLCSIGFKNKNIYKKKNSTCFEVAYSTKESLLFYDKFYKDNSMFLNRKRDVFENGIRLRNESKCL